MEELFAAELANRQAAEAQSAEVAAAAVFDGPALLALLRWALWPQCNEHHSTVNQVKILTLQAGTGCLRAQAAMDSSHLCDKLAAFTLLLPACLDHLA